MHERLPPLPPLGSWCPTFLINISLSKVMNSLLSIKVGVQAYFGTKVWICRCGLHLSYTKNLNILLNGMLVYFLLLWVETLLSLPLPRWIVPGFYLVSLFEHQYKESLTLWFWETDTKTWCFTSLRHFPLSNPIDAALVIPWHYVPWCTFSHLYDTPANN